MHHPPSLPRMTTSQCRSLPCFAFVEPQNQSWHTTPRSRRLRYMIRCLDVVRPRVMHHEPDSLLALFGASSPPTYVSSEGTSTYSFRKASHIRFFGTDYCFCLPRFGFIQVLFVIWFVFALRCLLRDKTGNYAGCLLPLDERRGARVSCIVSSDCCLSLREHMTCHARAGSTSYLGQFPIVTPCCAVQMAIISCDIVDKSKVAFAIDATPYCFDPLGARDKCVRVCLCHRGCK